MQVDIKEKGKWYRVYTGKYATKEKARQAAEEMVKKKVINEYFIFPLSDDQTAQNREKNIKKENSSPGKPITIIANRDSKRYHLPGMPFYDKVKKHHRVVFHSESEAINAGYHKAGSSNTRPAKDKQVPAPVTVKQKQKSSFVQSKQEIQSAKAKEDAVDARAKTVEKIRPPALMVEKKTGKAKITEQEPAEKEEAKSGSVLYDKALDELKKKDYERALLTFKEFVARDDTSNDLGERALRHMADCHFFLGEKGSKDHLLLAVQFYKNVLQSFPDQKRNNALIYLRLAKTYEYLNNYPDALKSYEYLISKYPQSAYIPEASFKTGTLLHQLGKYSQAVDKLIEYLKKYREGAFAKQAFYLVADSYYRMKQSASAEVLFRDAQKKWPDLTGVPKEVILNMGQHKYSLRRYDEAIKIFSFYVNLYSHDEKLKEALLLLANSYQADDQIKPALAVYNLIIDKYPDSKEAQESILAMASLGIDKPGAKMFLALGNINYYKDPLGAYKQLLEKNQKGDIAQAALLKKGDAFRVLKNDRKAADIYLEFLKMYPQSKMVVEARKSLKLAAGSLIDAGYQKKDYLAVSDIYFKAYRMVPLQADEYEIVDKMAVSLSNIGLTDDLIELLRNYKNVCKDDKVAEKIVIRIAKAEMGRHKYDEAEKILSELMTKTSAKNIPLIATIKQNMAEIAYRKKMYDKAVVDFAAVVKSGQSINDPGQAYWSYAASLKEKKENSLALQNYLIADKYIDQEKQILPGLGDFYKETGDLFLKANNYKDSLYMYNKALSKSADPEMKSWYLFSIGQTYQKMDNNSEAQKTFDKIKAQSGPEGFWTKVVDYHVSDKQWWNKYEDYLKN